MPDSFAMRTWPPAGTLGVEPSHAARRLIVAPVDVT